MFVVEQELYQAEGLDVAMQDFGMDLIACIIMFEKPMGIWAILEEESNFPKATDKTFEDKIKAQHLGKSANMAKAKSATDPNAHFAIIHYAGTVSYNVTGWLEKNKDPVNDTVVDVLKRGSCELMKLLWSDHPGQSAPPDEGKKKKKKGGGKTVSSVYLVQLGELMGTLNITEPHFIRCIVPNTHKKPLETECPLIMHQLTCNGVLEGIRVCMLEFPNKSDQRELMKVIQRNFRKYMTLRTWGWFIIIQKTKPLIGQINLEDELRMLEEAANAKFGAYEEQLK